MLQMLQIFLLNYVSYVVFVTCLLKKGMILVINAEIFSVNRSSSLHAKINNRKTSSRGNKESSGS